MSKKKENTENTTVEETTENVETEEVATETETAAEPSAEEKLQEELKTQKENYLRLAAEYDNYRKRTQAEKLRVYADATAKAVEELLPLTDSVTAALESTPEDDAQRQGIELISNQLAKCLEKLGVEACGEIGDTFDPNIHNAISRTEDENLPPQSLALIFQKGYKIGEKVIRPAMVQVANWG